MTSAAVRFPRGNGRFQEGDPSPNALIARIVRCSHEGLVGTGVSQVRVYE